MWQKTKTTSKAGFDKLYGWVDKLGPPVNKLSNKLGSEAFWPTTLDKESDKAARILRSFCRDGFYTEELVQPRVVDGKEEGPATSTKQKVLKKIPAEVIRNAKGLAVFTTMRTGLWVSGAGGSGILVGRLEDGSWSPPSGIMLHTAGLGFLIGVDIYDCVVVINTDEALKAFSKVRCTVGGEISAVAGPVGVGGMLETEVHKRQAPIFTYLKSRGFYAGVQIDGTIVIERTDENERFYGEKLSVGDILAGKVRHPPHEIKTLMETIKAAQGDTDVDASVLPADPAPGDIELEAPGEHIFGVPDAEDPDPFGVKALEQQGLEIREAGSHRPVSSDNFEFRPSPTSPIYNTFTSRSSMHRRSTDTLSMMSRRSSWRTSTVSYSTDRGTQTSDMSTQTDFDSPAPIIVPTTNGRAGTPKMDDIPENKSIDDVPATPRSPRTPRSHRSPTVISRPHSDEESAPHPDTSSHARHVSSGSSHGRSPSPPATNGAPHAETDEDDGEADLEADAEEAVIHEPATAQMAHSVQRVQMGTPVQVPRARLVTVVKPAPPKLPPRNPIRDRKRPLVIGATENGATQTSSPSSSSSPAASIRSSVGSVESKVSESAAEVIEAVGPEEDREEEERLARLARQMDVKKEEKGVPAEAEEKKVDGSIGKQETTTEQATEEMNEKEEMKDGGHGLAVPEPVESRTTSRADSRAESDDFHSIPGSPEESSKEMK